jgi:ATP-GRASP peptide maturase of grasp-with-spasm system
MICIFSTCVDRSTTEVIKWLNYLGKKDVVRINSDDKHPKKISITEQDIYFQDKKAHIPLSEIEAVWYRKGRHWLCDQLYPVSTETHTRFIAYLQRRLQLEETKLSEYLHFIIENTVPTLGSAVNGDLNKLLVLHYAKAVGLMTPNFYVSNYREGIQKIFQNSPDLITKAISDGIYFFDKIDAETGYFTYTEKTDPAIAETLAEQISPSLLQENIHKKYDLRVFVLDDQYYSMAILSQTDQQTTIDFRKYNEKKPNRNVPYLLPSKIETKLQKLFQNLGLNTGSADFIVDDQDNYFFLEINPVGQFDIVSSACNYYLEEKIAARLVGQAREIVSIGGQLR